MAMKLMDFATDQQGTGNTRHGAGNKEHGTFNRQQETGNRKQETGNRKQETGNRKQETLRNLYRPVNIQRRSSYMILKIFLIGFVGAASTAFAEVPQPQVNQEDLTVDRFGCQILQRPEHLTFTTFRDAWRSIAADKLYDIHRYGTSLKDQSCDCATLRPDWSVIEDDYQSLGFAAGESSTYNEWVDIDYFPVISGLRDAVQNLCGGIE
ncbi:hypothetical protein [Ruegeria sp. A3M17]|uniref:hypothetical protein n=1 Tax=Ruegeria sp. A3M17 TaxID=2267229 RepID=UPI000DE8E967|nr:hypothetical protein [Ruegeria sp. A3M17]RBW54768.1 hypothetical protein DS906_14585 [Ruegeria sp. A3M17]